MDRYYEVHAICQISPWKLSCGVEYTQSKDMPGNQVVVGLGCGAHVLLAVAVQGQARRAVPAPIDAYVLWNAPQISGKFKELVT